MIVAVPFIDYSFLDILEIPFNIIPNILRFQSSEL